VTDLLAVKTAVAAPGAVVITTASAEAAARGVMVTGPVALRATIDGAVLVVERGFADAASPSTVFNDGAVAAPVRKRVIDRL
jgi:hypothetical protein